MLRSVVSIIGVLACLLFGGVASGQLSDRAAEMPTEAVFSPAPDFVVEIEPADPDEAIHEPYGGVRYLLVDDQHDSRGEEPVSYYRQVREAINASGVDAIASLEVNFDPAYHSLVFHHVRLTRDGVTEDRKDRSLIEFARRETSRDRQMLNGEATAMLRMDDVRRGDIVDIAYSIVGDNPVFTDHDFRRFSLNWSLPVERRSIRSHWARGTVQHWDVAGGDADVERRVSRNTESFILEPAPRAAVDAEAGAPLELEQFASLRISSYADWNEVAEWARPLFDFEMDDSVQALAAEIAGRHSRAEAQLIEALRFVQNDIRYLALTYGEGSYLPAAPADTLDVRYGDCKAKTVLLMELARALGFEADAALVSLSTGFGLPDLEPSPGAFDHVIVRLTRNGETFWLDPTQSHQGGTLETLVEPDYGYALVLDGEGNGVERMRTEPHPTEPTVVIEEQLDISGGQHEPAYLDVVTTFTRANADYMRYLIAENGRSGIRRNYLDFYNGFFGEAQFLEPLAIEDDMDANRIVITERLELANPYEAGDQPGFYSFGYRAHAIPSLVESNAQIQRDTPLAVSHPSRRQHTVDIILTDGGAGWDLNNENVVIENAAFRYHHFTVHVGGRYRMHYETQSRTRAVPADTAAEVLREHEDMLNSSYYSFDMVGPEAMAIPEVSLKGEKRAP